MNLKIHQRGILAISRIRRIFGMFLLVLSIVGPTFVYFGLSPATIIKIHESIYGTEFYMQNYACHQFDTRKDTNVQREKNLNRISEDWVVPSKWMILLTVNNAFYDMFENWWKYFTRLHITINITVIAEDDQVFKKLITKYRHPNVKIVRSWVLDISSSAKFGSYVYNKMVSTRPTYILKYLEDCINVVYCDIDSAWLNSPFPYFKGAYDIWATTTQNGSKVCSGFMAIKSNTRTVTLMKRWIKVLAWKNQRNQPALNGIIPITNIKILRLDEKRTFVGGPAFSALTHENRSHVVIVHASSCFHHQGKVDCFKRWNMW